MWRFDYFKTDFATGVVEARQTLSNIVPRFRVEQTVGDEKRIITSDITLETTEPFPFEISISKNNWLGLYYNNQLVEVFWLGNHFTQHLTYSSLKKSTKLYQTTIPSIQQKFYEDISVIGLGYSTDTNLWNEQLMAASVHIDTIRLVDNSGSALLFSNRVGFSLGDLLNSMVGHSHYNGYVLAAHDLGPIPLKNANNLPIIYRGPSRGIGAPPDNILGHTFDFAEVKWLDIFRMLSFAFNAFVLVRPSFSGSPEKLYITISIVPRTKLSPSGVATLNWKDYIRERYKYQIEGVELSGLNFNFKQGGFRTKNILSRSIDIADPKIGIEGQTETLYWSAGDYNSAASMYDILGVGGFNRGYLNQNLVEPYYADILSDGHGYNGSFVYNGEPLLKHVVVDGETFQITKMTFDQDGIGSVEGPIISA